MEFKLNINKGKGVILYADLRRKLRELYLILTDKRELIPDDEIGAFLYVSRKESEKHRNYLHKQRFSC